MSWASRLAELESANNRTDGTDKNTFGGFVSSSDGVFHAHESTIEVARAYGLTVADLIECAGPDWPEIEHAPEAVEALANLVRANQCRARGEIPPEYSEPAVCLHCGPIWLFPSSEPGGKWHKPVLGCPWCHNRGAGLPIPKPREVLCGDCAHWRPDSINPADGVGTCGAGVTVQGRPIMPLRWHRSRCGLFVREAAP